MGATAEVSFWGAMAGGFLGTLVLTTVLRAGSEFGLTRMDLPFLLGTALSADRTRAKAVGFALHFVAGQVFAAMYYAVFVAIGESSWWLGGVFGVVHGLFAGTALVNTLLPLVHPRMGSTQTAANSTPLLEPPGFMIRNYGRATPLLTVITHAVYGAIVGACISL
jgi:hypothetical protein